MLNPRALNVRNLGPIFSPYSQREAHPVLLKETQCSSVLSCCGPGSFSCSKALGRINYTWGLLLFGPLGEPHKNKHLKGQNQTALFLLQETKMQPFSIAASFAAHEQLLASTRSLKIEIQTMHVAFEVSQSQNKVRSLKTSTIRMWKSTSLLLTLPYSIQDFSSTYSNFLNT